LSLPFWCVKQTSAVHLHNPLLCRRGLSLPARPVIFCAPAGVCAARICQLRLPLPARPAFGLAACRCQRDLSVLTRPVGVNAACRISIFVFARLSSAQFVFAYAACLRLCAFVCFRGLCLFSRLVFVSLLVFVFTACLCLRGLSRLVGVTTARCGLRGMSV
jgi:hypothetical protein